MIPKLSRAPAALFLVWGAAALGQQPQLPPNHPPIDRPAQSSVPVAPGDELPSGHPPVDRPTPSTVPVAPGDSLPAGHPPVAGSGRSSSDAGAAPESVDQLIREMDQSPGLAARDKPFQVAYSMGRLYYAKGRFKEATAFLRQAVEKGEPLRKLYLEQRARAGKRGPPSPEKSACGASADAALEEQEKAIAARAKKDGLAAASCARLALGLVLDAEQMLAAALFITGDSAGARASLERILQVAPDDADALSAHANILFETAADDLRELKKARAEWERALAVRPGASTAERTRRLIARADAAIAAGGFSRLAAKERASARVAAPASPSPVAAGAGSAPGGSGATATSTTASGSPVPAGAAAPPALSRETMEAFRNTKVTPEMEATFAKLIADAEDYLARGSYQQAMDNYRQVMPYQPENGRLRAGMAWALIGLNRQPMAENVWRVAVGSDPTAVEKLGETLQAKGDSRGAKALWGKLASSDPTYAERTGLKARLAK